MSKTMRTHSKKFPTTIGIFLGLFVFYLIANRYRN